MIEYFPAFLFGFISGVVITAVNDWLRAKLKKWRPEIYDS